MFREGEDVYGLVMVYSLRGHHRYTSGGSSLKTVRLLFLCARGSSRSILAASLLQAQAENYFEVWSSLPYDECGRALVEQVLYEQGTPLLSYDRLVQPHVGMHWEEGIVLCSGVADT